MTEHGPHRHSVACLTEFVSAKQPYHACDLPSAIADEFVDKADDPNFRSPLRQMAGASASSSAKAAIRSGLSSALAAFIEYDTPKIVHIQSKKVGVINRSLQAVIITYIVV